MNNGQVCAALKRLYVPESIYDELCDQLVEAAKGGSMGNGMDEGTTQGPLANKMQYDKVVSLLEDAKVNGGRILCGGEVPDGPGYFVPFTIIADVTSGMRIVDEEQFGPLLPVIKYTDLDDAIEHATDQAEVGLVESLDDNESAVLVEGNEAGVEVIELWIADAYQKDVDVEHLGDLVVGSGLRS